MSIFDKIFKKKAEPQKEYDRCLRCGRKLKSQENRLRGMGQTCWEKSQNTPVCERLFEIKK